MIHLIIGGARSGKSTYAEQLCLAASAKLKADAKLKTAANNKPIYVATGVGFDEEMRHRIALHKEQRKEAWDLIECPLNLSELFKDATKNQFLNNAVLLDCLTVWLNNQVFKISESIDMNSCYSEASQEVQHLCKQLTKQLETFVNTPDTHIYIVANEVGLGIVPLGSSNRLFVDNMGWLNQGIARIADSVTLITAGIPLILKGNTSTFTTNTHDRDTHILSTSMGDAND